MSVAGIVLCGGESSRMGRPKAWLPIGGETMLGRIVRVVGEVVSPVVVVAAPEQELPPLPEGVDVLRDEVMGAGPLAGIVTGLRYLTGMSDAAYVSSCDIPLLRADFVRRMIDRLGDADIAVPNVRGRFEPMAGVYRIRVLSAAEEALKELCRKMTMLMERVPTSYVTDEELVDVDPDFASLRNVNTPEEYEAVGRAFQPDSDGDKSAGS
jgi:molybdopterin-guanine dinucleotide biosynthesis protein A